MIDLRLLGAVAIADATGQPARDLIAQPRRFALLAYLAAAMPRGPHRRDSILPLFWPELDQRRARAALRQALHVVRGDLGADVLQNRGDEEIGLDFARVRCDVVAFDEAIASGTLEQALDLWRGDLLEGFFLTDAPGFERWLEEERARLRAAAAGAAHTLSASAEKAGNFAAAALWSRRATQLAPHDESEMRRLIRLLDATGDRAGALSTYENFARRLREDLDVLPSAESQALVAAVRARDHVVRGSTGLPASITPTSATFAHETVAPRIATSTTPTERRGRRAVIASVIAIVAALPLGIDAWRGYGATHPPASAAQSPLPAINREAYDLYLRGRISVVKEDSSSNAAAIELFERAVSIEPAFASAYAELAHAYGLRANQFAPGDSDARTRAGIAVAKSLALNPNLAEAHFAHAFLLWNAGRGFPHDLAIQEDRKALALNPNLAQAHQHLGQIYLHIGLLDAAILEFRRGLALDPDQALAQQRIGIAQAYQGHYLQALETLRQVPPSFNPALWHYQVAWAMIYLGQDSAALALVDEYLGPRQKDPGGVATAARAILEAKHGEAALAERDIQVAISKGTGFQHFHHTAYSIAMVYALLHRPKPALQYLRLAADNGLPCYPCFRDDPYLANLRADAGYQEFLSMLRARWQRWQAAFAGDSVSQASRH